MAAVSSLSETAAAAEDVDGDGDGDDIPNSVFTIRFLMGSQATVAVAVGWCVSTRSSGTQQPACSMAEHEILSSFRSRVSRRMVSRKVYRFTAMLDLSLSSQQTSYVWAVVETPAGYIT